MTRKHIIILVSIIVLAGCAIKSHHAGHNTSAVHSAGRHNQIGNDYFSKGQYDLAIVEYQKAIKIFPQYAKAYSNMGYAHFEKKQYDRAIEEFTRAIRNDPMYAKAYNNRGMVYFAKGEYDRAILDYNKAIEINPELARPYDNRGAIYMLMGATEKACSDFVKACELGECATLELLKEIGGCNFNYLAMTDSYRLDDRS